MSHKLTIVSATDLEIQPLLDHLNKNAVRFSQTSFHLEDVDIDILITGIGILHSAYSLMDYLMVHRPDAWIQLGIGGALDHSLTIGNVYFIESEVLVDFGAQDKDGRIISPFELGWIKPDEFPYKNEILNCPYIPSDILISRASGMTTIHAHGFQEKIETLSKGLHGQIENMEGAPFFYVSLMKKIPFLSIRAISNYVETRNTYNWQIKIAVEKLNTQIVKLLKENFFQFHLCRFD